jgi:predicted Ser/Thr protein kinase
MSETPNEGRRGAPPPDREIAGERVRRLLELGLMTDVVHTRGGAAQAPAPTPTELEELLPQYEVESVIGRGGMGVVYRARQRSLDRLVALKVLTAPIDADADFEERFRREARALASLSHPGIVAVHDFGRAGEYWFLAMEYVDGTDLRRVIDSRAITPREALSIVGQVCDALQFAHDRGVVHRDVKPANVLLDRDGRVKISDFGLAKLIGAAPAVGLTRSAQVMGTPHYMAPEQIETPLSVDHRADIYSLGVVFYELLTGELPIGRFSPPSQRVQVDVRLDDVVMRALEKDPPRRYQHASDVRTDVDRVVAEPGAACCGAPGGARVVRRHEKRAGHKLLVTLVVLALLFAGAMGLGAVAWLLLPAPPPGGEDLSVALVEIEDGELRVHGVEFAGRVPRLADRFTSALALVPQEVADLNALLRAQHDRYLEIEKAATEAVWDGDQGRVSATVAEFPTARLSLVQETRRFLSERLGETELPESVQADIEARLFPYGAEEVHLELRPEQEITPLGIEGPYLRVTNAEGVLLRYTDRAAPEEIARFFDSALEVPSSAAQAVAHLVAALEQFDESGTRLALENVRAEDEGGGLVSVLVDIWLAPATAPATDIVLELESHMLRQEWLQESSPSTVSPTEIEDLRLLIRPTWNRGFAMVYAAGSLDDEREDTLGRFGGALERAVGEDLNQATYRTVEARGVHRDRIVSIKPKGLEDGYPLRDLLGALLELEEQDASSTVTSLALRLTGKTTASGMPGWTYAFEVTRREAWD